jgi:hypothetical protein
MTILDKSGNTPRVNKNCSLEQQPSAEQEWERFTDDLIVCLADLQEDEFLILSAKKAKYYYVQFAAQGKFGMRAEASDNFYIPPEAQLSADDYAAMVSLGWRIPSAADPDAESTPNFYLDLRNPVDIESLVQLATRTLRRTYKVKHPGTLQYKAFASNGMQIRFPTLRLKREQ